MNTSRWIGLSAASLVAAAFSGPIPASAQDDVLVPGGPITLRVEPLNVVDPQNADLLVARLDDGDDDEAPSSEYWLGLQVEALPEITKRQLVLKHGLAVEDVSPESPAAKAEIKRFDILMQAADTPLKAVADLVKTVEAAQGKEIVIVIKRDGESKTIRVTADKRSKPEAAMEIVRKKIEASKPELAGEIKQLEEALEKLKSKAGKDGIGMWFAKPAIVAPKMDFKFDFDNKFHSEVKADFPKDLSVQINKQGTEPTKIHVKRGDQEWNVTEKTLDELPKEIRGHVEKMMGQHMHLAYGPAAARAVRVSPEGKVEGVLNIRPVAPAPPVPPMAPAPPAPPAPPKAPAATRAITARVERSEDGTAAKLDAIMKKLEKLEDEVEALRDKK